MGTCWAHPLDALDDLRAQIARDGLTVRGSMGQPRPNPALREVGSAQLVLDRLLWRLRSRLDADTGAFDALAAELSVPTKYG